MSERAAEKTSTSPKSDEGYVVVARRYRPTSFRELIGQDQVAQALRTAIESNRVGHAYLFTGARGVGKTSAARIFGKALNCVKGPTPNPCNECDVCRSVASGEDVDVLEIDGASNRGIEEIRQLRSTVSVRPSRGRYKVYIIDEVHMLTTAAFNALLKTLEEPPEHVKFVFCTTDPEKIPITVLSRCQRFDFPPVHVSAIQQRLKQIAEMEGAHVEDDALALLARRAAGSMRDSQSLLEQLLAFGRENVTADDVHRMLGTAGGGRLANLLAAIIERDVPRALQEVDGAVLEGVDPGQLAEQLLHCFRDLLVVAHQGDASLLNSQLAADVDRLRSAAERWGPATALAGMQMLDHSLGRMRFSLHTRVLLEMAVVRLATLADLDAVDRLARVMVKGANPGALLSAARIGTGQLAQPTATDASLGEAGSGSKKNERPEPQSLSSAPQPPATHTPPPAVTPAPARPTAPSEAGNSTASARTPTGPSASQVSSSQSLTAETAQSVWIESLRRSSEQARGFASDFDRVATGGPNTLVVTLRSSYNKDACERPELREQLESAVASVVGDRVRLEFRALPAPPPPANPGLARSQFNRRQMLRDLQRHPWVSEAMTMFEAEIIDVRPPRRRS
ncbi:MAG: DNA polymerase III subunit gamma/tau [Planctomycetales bacterium]|nr:DNA polymerase III subunit gamma/tau [Planctomycetales bacterium]